MARPSVLEAAQGPYRGLLVALRDHVAAAIDDGCSARDLVGLSRRLVDLAAEIRALDTQQQSGLRVVSDEKFDPKAI